MVQRRLSAEDAALWARVAASAKPISGRKPVDLPRIALPSVRLTDFKPHPAPEPLPRPTKRTSGNTLDATWDRRLEHGTVRPDYVIDLHEHTLAAAHARLDFGLECAIAEHARIVLLITGKARPDNPRLPPTTRGVIRASVDDWLASSRWAGSIAAVRKAHPRHGGAGALYLILRRSRG